MPVTVDPLRVLPTAPARKAPRLDGVTVLVVDDHDDGRVLVANILGQSGAAVLSAANAAEALDLLREKRPDVLLSDIEMPDESGYEL